MTKPPLSLRPFGAFLGAVASLLTLPHLSAMPLPLSVAGTQLVNSQGGPVRLRGVNCAGLEWSADGEGHMLKSVQVAVVDWHANLIRLPLSQDSWFGKGPDQTDGGQSYRDLVKRLVAFCADHDAYLLLDLHWSDAGDWGQNIGQHKLPDRNSVIFWKEVAQSYRDHPAVLFDLYNEPHNITWDEWLRGGPVTEQDDRTKEVTSYKAVGLQALLDAIRSTGAGNVVVASGINWAYELEGIPQGHALSDPHGRGVIYGAHPYPHAFEHLGRETIAQWAARMDAFAKKFPLIVTEFGSHEKEWPFPKDWAYHDEKWNREMLRVLEARPWSWTAWDFHPSAAPCLLADWNYTPTPHFGAWVKEALAKNLPGAGR